jgi:hypothetical protein
VVVAGGADRPSPEGHFIDDHAYGVVDLETPECRGLRQRTSFL